MSLETFHPAVRRWFETRLGDPTPPQIEAWPVIRSGRHALIAAPTGSGKTLAAFLAAIDDLVRRGLDGTLTDTTHVVYVSPLKALSNDIRKNLEEPLAGIRAGLKTMDLPAVEIRTAVRTGDTTASERASMIKRPPHILVTTPESLYILLTSEGGRRMLRSARTLIVDEIHAVADDKRGSHLALSMERLAALTEAGAPHEEDGGAATIEPSGTGNLAVDAPPHPLVRIGLSATQKPIEDVARFLVGTAHVAGDGAPDCAIIDTGHRRRLDMALEMTGSPLETVMSGEVWIEVYDRLALLVAAHDTTLVFVNTRRMAERVTRFLSERLGVENVAAHHGSLSKEQRFGAEQRLKSGNLKAMVATASLELGIDIGEVNLVCQIGSPRSIAAFLQRVGRSGHFKGGLPKGRLIPLSRDELVECAALIDAVRRGELDRLVIPEKPLDILAQQIVAAVAAEEWTTDALFDRCRAAWPYRNLERKEFDDVVRMLAEGFTTRRGRRGALLHHDAVGGRLRPRRGSRLTAITSGGAIPENADYRVILEPTETFIGTVNEDFAIESSAGDIFQLGNASWRILRLDQGKVRVQDAKGSPPSVPFWLGEAPGRTPELSEAVSRFRAELSSRLDSGIAAARAWLGDDMQVVPEAGDQIIAYLAAARAALGVLPTQDTLVIERFFDEAGDMHLVLHAPFGSRLNRAWGLALRKRFCRTFNFELQAAATEDAIILSLGPTHSFQLADVFRYLTAKTVRDVLTQALLDAPMFAIRWRWNAGRALAVPRFRGGKKVPPPLQRMNAEDLIAVVFPDQLACLENITGERQVPDHPLVQQTIKDCLEEAMDIDRLEALIASIEAGEKKLVVKDLTGPSPLALDILNARPYAFLDDAPLEERRTQAVSARRWLTPEAASELGTLSPEAIALVKEEAAPDVRDADELHDALVLNGFLTEEDVRRWGGGAASAPARDGTGTPARPDSAWTSHFADLVEGRRAAVMTIGPLRAWMAAERLTELRAVYPTAKLDPVIEAPPAATPRAWTAAEALVEILRGRMESIGPVTAGELAQTFALPVADIDAALAALETQGFVFRGSFHPGATETEWCERRLLARIHRTTLDTLRREIEPVAAADFMKFLLGWQRVEEESRMEGPESLARILDQLEGFEAPAGAWEKEVLPARLKQYDPVWLDALCLSGQFVWHRRRPKAPGAGAMSVRGGAPRAGMPSGSRAPDGGSAALSGPASPTTGRLPQKSGPVRTTSIGLLRRENLEMWRRAAADGTAPVSGQGLAGSRGGGGKAAGGAAHVDPEVADPPLSSTARAVLDHLKHRGASFFAEMVRGTGLLKTQVEQGLGELVTWGLVSADSFGGLRALITPSGKRPALRGGRRRHGMAAFGIETSGRWFTVDQREEAGTGYDPRDPAEAAPPHGPDRLARGRVAEAVARTLLRRYGIVFRAILDREGNLPPWRELLLVYRRLEARGEIRGGRFVAGFTGEQYALPEAVSELRKIRRAGTTGVMTAVSAADPLNLTGILLAGERVPAITGNRILYRDGVAIAVYEKKEVRTLVDMDTAERWRVQEALVRRRGEGRMRAGMRSF